MTPLEVLDTAVKVGLGALISGLTAYWASARKIKDELARERLLRHQTLLEGTAEQVEAFSHLVFRYWALMIELVRTRNQQVSFSAQRQQDLEKAKADLFDSYSGLTSAESKLLLLGHSDAQQLLRQYGESVREFRRRAFDGNKSLTEEELTKDRAQLLSIREALFKELSHAYRAET